MQQSSSTGRLSASLLGPAGLIVSQVLVSAGALILEIVAGRMLAPYVGMSVYTWTAVIAVVLAGLSAGALGGKLTGAGLGGCVVLLAPHCQDEVAEAIRGAGGRPYMASVDEGARREI